LRTHALQVLPLAARGGMMIVNGLPTARARAQRLTRPVPGGGD